MKGYPVVPSDYGIIYDPVTIETPDCFSLQGWFFPAQDTAGISNNLVGKLIPVPDSLKPPLRIYLADDVLAGATIVICPGDAGNMSFSILYAYNLFVKGFNVFTFDWRGFGESDTCLDVAEGMRSSCWTGGTLDCGGCRAWRDVGT